MPDTCFPASKKGEMEHCTSNPGMDGFETKTIYTVDAKGIITDVYQMTDFISPTSIGGSIKPIDVVRKPEPLVTPEQQESLDNFYKQVHQN